MTTLNPVKQGTNTYCGPAVLASLAGITTDEAEKLINQLRNKTTPVKGVYLHEIRAILQRLGYSCTPVKAGNSLFMFLTTAKEGKYLIQVPSHFVLVEVTADGKRYFLDNHTREAISGASSARLGQQVVSALKVWK